MRWMHGMRARLGLLARSTAEERMQEEMLFHLEMETEKHVRAGMTPEEARRRAALSFGGVEGHKEEMREGRTLSWISGASLDLKLGWRMLVKYPGLTLVGGLAMAFAVWVGVGAFEIISQTASPELPLADGKRIVGLQVRDLSANEVRAPTLHDLEVWREEMRSVGDLGGFRTAERNLESESAGIAPVSVTEISASAFQVARVAPLLGRALVEDDESPSAPPVAVIGYELWQRRFGGAGDVIGRTVRLGDVPTTVVGVMPEGFAFPVNDELWVPIRLNPLEYAPGNAPSLRVFGRLAPGVSLEEANAELRTLGARMAADRPEPNRRVRPEVLPYAESILPVPTIRGFSKGIYLLNLIGLLLMALMCGNVALLMFARAASREGEIAVRHALGASRGRIIVQLFFEALVLGGLAALVGLAGARYAVEWTMKVIALNQFELPFWFHAGLSPQTVLYAALLTVAGAFVAGIVPGLKVTRGLEARLRRASAGGGGFRFGGIWTAVIVAQIAITVILPVVAYVFHADASRIRAADVGIAESDYLTAELEIAPPAAAAGMAGTPEEESAARARATYLELERRLLSEPGVAGVTFASRLPRMYHNDPLVELEDGAAHRVSVASVAPDYFEVLGAPVLAGRVFTPADVGVEPGEVPGVVVVNQSFVDEVLGGRNAIGRRIRYASADGAEPGPWYEIVGVVQDLGMAIGVSLGRAPSQAGFYHPAAPGATRLVSLAVQVRGEPAAFTPRLRAIAAAVDPALRIEEPMPMNRLSDATLEFLGLWIRLVLGVCGVALLLSLAGIYAVMAFTVTQRTREIGVRIALGAGSRRLILEILSRPLTQVSMGIAAGALLVVAMGYGVTGTITLADAATYVIYPLLMLGVCLLACIVPVRRALGVEPTEALRADA